MKTHLRIPTLILVTLAVLLLTGCMGFPQNQPGLVIGDSYRLDSGETLDTDLTVVGGNANLEEDSTVNGDVVVIGGNVNIDGSVNGDLSVMGGYVYLDNNARIEGSVETLGGTIQRSEGAVVEGKDLGDRREPGRITTLRSPAVNISFEPVTATLMAIFQAMALAALAIIVSLFALRPMENTGRTAMNQAPVSGGVGCLTILVLLIMAITIILLPVSLIGFLAVGIAALFGWVTLGLLLGRRLAVWLKQPWSDPVNAGVGTLVLSLAASMVNLIPCVGWLVTFTVTMIGIGAVVLSRFGTQVYPRVPTALRSPNPPSAPSSTPPASTDVSNTTVGSTSSTYTPPTVFTQNEGSTGGAVIYPADDDNPSI
jgi:hypothetical protein